MNQFQLTDGQIERLAQDAFDAGNFQQATELMALIPGGSQSDLALEAAFQAGKKKVAAGDVTGGRKMLRAAAKGPNSGQASLARDKAKLLGGRGYTSTATAPGLETPARVKPVLALPEDLFAPTVDRVIAFAAYRSAYDQEKSDPFSRALLRMKRGKGRILSVEFGNALARFVMGQPSLLVDVDLILPIPTDPSRTTERGYGIPELMVEAISYRCGVPGYYDVLQTNGPLPELRYLARGQRPRAIAGCYRVEQPSLVRNQHVLIADDVITSGATVKEVARVLKAAGARRVTALALAHSESSSQRWGSAR